MKYNGLTDQQVEDNRKQHGSNALTDIAPMPFYKRILKGFRDPMIMILTVALAIQLVLFILGRAAWYEPFGVFVAILIANGVAAVFETRQERKASALRHAANAKERTKVVRNGMLVEIPTDDVVTEDIVFLQAGDKIPADGILLDGDLKVDQSALNGESEEAPKAPAGADAACDFKDLLNHHTLYRGTVICSGEAYQCVKVTGDRTIFGQAALAAQEAPRPTPLQIKLGKLAKQITTFGYFGAAAIIAIILLITLFSGDAPDTWTDWLKLIIDAVTVAVTIIVCAVPEGLPMLSSILQALQSLKMVKDNVLVRKINGLETSGSLSILFSDKTGTITEGKLSVVEFALGNTQAYGHLADVSEALRSKILMGIGANNSAIASGENIIGGNGTDRALMAYLVAEGYQDNITKDAVVAFNAFDSNKKTSSIVVKENDGQVTYMKGAPERILEKCSFFVDATGTTQPLTDKAAGLSYLDEQAARSMRLLAVATATTETAEDGWTLICILCIRDNVRKEAQTAIQEIHHAGIQVVMVTGDRKETAVAIAKEAGLLQQADDLALTSFEMSEMSDDELKAVLPRLRVVSRALPLDKSRLVRLAQELDYVVGMTGDGVNDSPALRKSDVGFAMGSGTEVAKAAGDITILDDNLSSIEKAILYGRSMFKSIRKFLLFQLTVNVAAVLICAIGPMFGINVVMTVIQLLIVNLAMDTLAALAYGSEPPLKEYMNEKPIPRSESILSRKMMMEILINAAYITLLCLGILLVPCIQSFIGITLEHKASDTLLLHSTIFATFMMAITFNGFNVRTTHINPFEGIGRNMTFLLVMGAIFALQFVFVTFGGEPLSVTPLPAMTWIKCMLLAFLVIPVDMLRKCLTR